MRIGFLHKVNTTPPRSGGSVHTYQVSQYLAQRGHQLLALENEQGDQFSQRFPRSLKGLRALFAAADLLYFRIDGKTGWEITPLLPGLMRSGKPIVWEVNATLEELKVLPEPLRWSDRLGPLFRRLTAAKVNAALCVSEPLVRYAQALGIRDVLLVPNGSDPQRFSPQDRDPSLYEATPGSFRVLWAGSTQYGWHDFNLMLDCARQIQTLDPEISFVVLGERSHLDSSDMPGNVQFYPPVPYLEVPKWFASADLGLCLYRDIHWSRYGFFFSPLKLFDYAASGIPVLYTSSAELSRVAQPFGLPVAPGDVAGLTAAILRLKADRALHHQLAIQARQAILDYYNWERVGQQTEAVLLNLVQQPFPSGKPSTPGLLPSFR